MPDDFTSDDFRRTCKFKLSLFRFETELTGGSALNIQGENFYKNRAIVDDIKKLADKKGCSVTQVAIA
jgi:hypothetical protein